MLTKVSTKKRNAAVQQNWYCEVRAIACAFMEPEILWGQRKTSGRQKGQKDSPETRDE